VLDHDSESQARRKERPNTRGIALAGITSELSSCGPERHSQSRTSFVARFRYENDILTSNVFYVAGSVARFDGEFCTLQKMKEVSWRR